ncbi:hypothetical protein ACFLRT_02695 [Acidobacteriota bacterium]
MNAKFSLFTTKAPGYRIYILIAIPIVLFNLIVVFGLRVLIADDASVYCQMIKGLDVFMISKFIHLAIGRIILGTSFYIMRLSLEIVRGIYVLFLMVPISCLFYHLLHKKMGIPKIAAYTAAVLPNILPGQHLIPAYINGSQVLVGMIAVLCCFFAIFRYLDAQSPKSWKMLITAVLLYLIATQLDDQPVFSFPVLIFAILGYHKLNRKHIFLAASLCLVFLHKSAWMLFMTRDFTVITTPTIQKSSSRLGILFSSMLPLPDFLKESKELLAMIFIVIVITAFIFYIREKDKGFDLLKPFAHLSHKKFIFYIYGFLLAWIVSNIFVFITIAPKFTIRYGYITSYGINTLLVISLYPILKKIFHKKNKILYLTFAILIIISGISRFVELKERFNKVIYNYALIKEHLNKFKFPGDSQIVLYYFEIDAKIFRGTLAHSSGHLKFMLKRNDIDGLIGWKKNQYFNFYNPFDVKKRGPMQGIDINRPVFLFIEENKKFKQYEYAFQWKEKAGKSEWTIFNFDKKTGKASSLSTGNEIDNYFSALKRIKKKGITQKDILWGGQASKKDLERL